MPAPGIPFKRGGEDRVPHGVLAQRAPSVTLDQVQLPLHLPNGGQPDLKRKSGSDPGLGIGGNVRSDPAELQIRATAAHRGESLSSDGGGSLKQGAGFPGGDAEVRNNSPPGGVTGY